MRELPERVLLHSKSELLPPLGSSGLAPVGTVLEDATLTHWHLSVQQPLLAADHTTYFPGSSGDEKYTNFSLTSSRLEKVYWRAGGGMEWTDYSGGGAWSIHCTALSRASATMCAVV